MPQLNCRTLILLAAVLLAGCGSTASPLPATTPVAGTPAARVPILHTPPAIGPRTLVVRDQDNGHAVSVRVGDHVLLVLASTYWQLAGSSDPGVLRQAGTTAASPQTSGCVPGAGCGTVSAAFDALARGSAEVSATRTSCGEALRCGSSDSHYRVTVLVVG